ncbi:CocE/NonD family hydrolase [Phenylobacterium sp. J367]|uniref:CocE/NonD family hydrolase n=1 Tax=Phenylobacterium sp. J367 TaxID=2898435 RepID=UPI0021517649|nr:CocE/NonD family hydrolase [Phenylobacterium sp. J367]MCR5879574.1 CocE/NonD family hydrolase [Phenylobacterium sp. J367]
MTHDQGPAARQGLHRRTALRTGAAFGLLGALPATAPAAERVSRFGAYSGYSTAAYDGWVRTSLYVPVRDGTRLAVDIYRPTRSKALHTEPLPVVWQPKRYQRAVMQPDGVAATLMGGRDSPTASYISKSSKTLIRHGYVIASVDRRGTGASFGSRSELSDPIDATDGHDVSEWLAAQPWCTGKVGMFGASYEGEMQLRVAATRPPHLRAIMPEVSPFDWYWTVHPGGIARTSQAGFATMLARIDTDPNNGPVDADADKSLLNAALAEHRARNDYSAPAGKLPYRDSRNPVTGEQNWLNRHGGHFAGLAKSGIAVYHVTGWFANVGVHQWVWWDNARGTPQKMLIGPWAAGGARTETERDLCAIEAHRFFDHWLKGVQNGIMAEPAIHSSIPSSHTRNGGPWKGLPAAWPLANERRTEFFLAGGKTGTAGSVNDGRLTRARPEAEGRDDLQVRYDCDYEGGCEPAEPGKPPIDHAGFDAQGLTYTSEPLEADMEVTGHGVARLWVTSTAEDGDFFLKLQDVDPNGVSTYVANGALRASHRALGEPPYRFLGLPWNRSHQADMKPLIKGEPNELVFALFPTSYIFKAGHRLRVTLTGSDLDTGPSPQVSPAPVVSLHRSARHASSVVLPIIPA